jgi:hypothetical protein
MSEPKRVAGNPPYIDRPEVAEVYADSLYNLTYDGRNLRLEFAVFRNESPQGDQPPATWAYTACRVVLSGPGMIDLLHKMARLQRKLADEGILNLDGSPRRGRIADPSGP